LDDRKGIVPVRNAPAIPKCSSWTQHNLE